MPHRVDPHTADGADLRAPAFLGSGHDPTGAARWFEAVLGASGALGDARVTEVHLEPVNGGLLARMLRAGLTYDRATSAPATVVVKYPTDHEGSLGVARAMGLYELEVRFYQEVAPLTPVSVPGCHFADYDAASGEFVLVLEDLRGRTRPGDGLAGCTPDECARVLAELVKFQAPLWNSPALERMGWLADPSRAHATFDAFTLGVGPFLERFGDVLDPAHVTLFETVLPRAGDWVRSWSRPTVVQHGDFRPDNLMFGAAPGAPPVTVIDFQTVRCGPPGVDLAYFVGSALSTRDRRAAEKDLVACYHDGLRRAGITDFDIDECWNAYREGALYGVMLLGGQGAAIESTERGDRIIVDQLIRPYADMAIDLDSVAAAGLT